MKVIDKIIKLFHVVLRGKKTWIKEIVLRNFAQCVGLNFQSQSAGRTLSSVLEIVIQKEERNLKQLQSNASFAVKILQLSFQLIMIFVLKTAINFQDVIESLKFVLLAEKNLKLKSHKIMFKVVPQNADIYLLEAKQLIYQKVQTGKTLEKLLLNVMGILAWSAEITKTFPCTIKFLLVKVEIMIGKTLSRSVECVMQKYTVIQTV